MEILLSMKNSSRKPKHFKCYYCHTILVNLKGSYRHAQYPDAVICMKIRDTRMLIDELGFDLVNGEFRQIKQIDPSERVYTTSSSRRTKGDSKQ